MINILAASYGDNPIHRGTVQQQEKEFLEYLQTRSLDWVRLEGLLTDEQKNTRMLVVHYIEQKARVSLRTKGVCMYEG